MGCNHFFENYLSDNYNELILGLFSSNLFNYLFLILNSSLNLGEFYIEILFYNLLLINTVLPPIIKDYF